MLQKVITLLLAISISLSTQAAEKKVSCNEVITACDKALADKDVALKDLNLALTASKGSLDQRTTELNKDEAKLSAWYHNPLIMTALGIAIGSLAVGMVRK